MATDGKENNMRCAGVTPQTIGGSEVFAKNAGAASQAGRRRFDPGRPLQNSLKDSSDLEASRETALDLQRASSPIHHPKLAGKLAANEALGARFTLGELAEAVVLEGLYQRVRRRADSRARATFAAIINPERFVEPRKANAGDAPEKSKAEKVQVGEKPCRAEIRSRGNEATGVGGNAWRSSRIV